jgi:acetylornithine deacetylase/succinyl-diaminopimelate desuccinylase-like protein
LRISWCPVFTFHFQEEGLVKKLVLRVACFAFAAATLVPTIAVAQTAGGSSELTEHQRSGRDIFRELIEINTSLTMGSTKAAEAMAARLKSAGFPESDIQLVGPQPQHMNLVVRYRGSGVRRPVLFICHLDVVEALRQDWSFDPFTFLELDGYFYGRGTTDIKDEAADLIAAFIRLKREGFTPDRDLIVALTEDEESGDANGVQWLLRDRRDLIDAEFCINPDGGGGEMKNGRHTVMAFQTCEKVYLDFTFEAKNKGGHSSMPVKDNAIYRLASALTRLQGLEFPITLNETTRLSFERSALQETGQTRADMLAMAAQPLDTAAANRLAASSPYYNSMLRTTCVATMLSGGHAQNALPQSARANVNCRMLPDDTPQHVLETLQVAVADPQVSVTCAYASTAGPRSPLRKDVLDAVERVAGAMWPGVVVTPIMSTGATDGKYLRAAGIPVYGVSGMFGKIDDVRAHGRDERIGVKEFYEGLEFMYRFIKALARAGD